MQTDENKWNKMLTRLQAYQQEHNGSCNVPKNYRQGPKLGRWVDWQRTRYRKGLLTKERFDQLEAIGFQWTLREQTEWTKILQHHRKAITAFFNEQKDRSKPSDEEKSKKMALVKVDQEFNLQKCFDNWYKTRNKAGSFANLLFRRYEFCSATTKREHAFMVLNKWNVVYKNEAKKAGDDDQAVSFSLCLCWCN